MMESDTQNIPEIFHYLYFLSFPILFKKFSLNLNEEFLSFVLVGLGVASCASSTGNI